MNQKSGRIHDYPFARCLSPPASTTKDINQISFAIFNIRCEKKASHFQQTLQRQRHRLGFDAGKKYGPRRW